MKKTLVTLFIAAAMVACGGPGSGDNPSNQAQNSELTTSSKKVVAHIGVEGMTCAMGCAKAIENNLNDLTGVKIASVSFDEKVATIEFNTGELSKDDIVKTITSTNGGGIYEVTTVELEELVQNGLENTSEESDENATQEKEDNVNVSVSSVGSGIISEKLDLIFPSIFRAVLDIY